MKVDSQPVVAKCQTCGGSGMSEVGDVLGQTLDALRRGGRPLTVAELHFGISTVHGAGVGITAVNQRLERLRALGLVERRRDGHYWLYWVRKGRK